MSGVQEQWVCWRCGAAVADLPRPFSRTAECAACRADLHVCKMCRFFAPNVRNGCREPMAEPVSNKERSNFCAFHQAAPNVYRAQDHSAADAARAQLDALFGATPSATTPSSEDAARAQLEQLFSKKSES